LKAQPPCNKKHIEKIEKDFTPFGVSDSLMDMFWRLYEKFGPQYWWPGQTPFEIAIGAILTQNTNWQNVERAISNLKGKSLLDCDALFHLPSSTLSQLIRPAGYYNIKAKRLKSFVTFLRERFNGDMERMKEERTHELRKMLLNVHGIGPETADSILLYALSKKVFVVDAYTIRIFSRHELIDPSDYSYDSVQELFMRNLPKDACLFNEYHALIVRTGKEFCKKKRPQCSKCPLNGT